jgi:hypothetical protein
MVKAIRACGEPREQFGMGFAARRRKVSYEGQRRGK